MIFQVNMHMHVHVLITTTLCYLKPEAKSTNERHKVVGLLMQPQTKAL